MKLPIRRRHIIRATCLAMSLALTAAALAVHATPVIYPAKGQPPMQQDRDRYECYDWARSQSGFDPMQQPSQTTAPASAATPSGPSLPHMAMGAAGGAAIAELTDHDAGKGAAAGLLGATVIGKVREQQAMQARQQQQAAQQQAARSQARATYERGFAACMEARGYVVK